LTYVASCERHRGYQDSLTAADLIYDRALIQKRYFMSDSGYHAMKTLLELENAPTAIVVVLLLAGTPAMIYNVRGLQESRK